MNEALKWFLFDMSSYLAVRDGTTFSITNIGVDLFRFGKYVRGTITGIGTAIWDSTGRLVYPTTYADGTKNLVLKMTLAQMTTEDVVPPIIDEFLDMTGGVYGTYNASVATVSQYQLGPNKNLIRMLGNVGATNLEWSSSGEPINNTIDFKLGMVSEMSNYDQFETSIPNWSQTIEDQWSSGLNTLVAGSNISLLVFYTNLSRNVEEYRGQISGVDHVWDGNGNHLTSVDNNMIDIVTTTDFQNNY